MILFNLLTTILCSFLSIGSSNAQWTKYDLLTSPSDVKGVLDFSLPETSSYSRDLSRYNDGHNSDMKIITDGSVSSIITMPSEEGRLRYLYLRTNDGTNGMNENNDPTSFQIYGQSDVGSPLEAIKKETRINLPSDRSTETWIRSLANKDYKYYLIIFKNDKGNGMEINFRLGAKRLGLRA